MTDEREIPRRERAHDRRVLGACVFEERHEQQRARVVVQAVAIVVARDAEDGVLEHAGVVGHRLHVLQVDLGQAGRSRGERLRAERGPAAARVLGSRAREALDVAARRPPARSSRRRTRPLARTSLAAGRRR